MCSSQASTHTHTHTHTHIHTHNIVFLAGTHTYTHTHTRIILYSSQARTHIHTYTRARARAHTRTHTYTHTHPRARARPGSYFLNESNGELLECVKYPITGSAASYLSTPLQIFSPSRSLTDIQELIYILNSGATSPKTPGALLLKLQTFLFSRYFNWRPPFRCTVWVFCICSCIYPCLNIAWCLCMLIWTSFVSFMLK